MNQVATAMAGSETTILEDNSSGHVSLFDSSSAASTSIRSSLPNNINQQNCGRGGAGGGDNDDNGDGLIRVYNYKIKDFEKFTSDTTCEEICIHFCHNLNILPTTKLLFGIRVHNTADATNKWILPGEHLTNTTRYCFRMRFKIPELDTQLQIIDINSHEYLYYQMRYDMLHEHIAEIKYPAKKDNVMGLGVVDMAIDMLEKFVTVQQIEKEYKNYLPRKLVRAHGLFVKSKICHTFRELRSNSLHLGSLKWHYVNEIYNLAPKYLMERFKCVVEHLPYEMLVTTNTNEMHCNATTPRSANTSITTLNTSSNTTLATTTTTINGNNICNDTQTLRSVSSCSFSNSSQHQHQQHYRSQQQQQRQHQRQQQCIGLPVYVELSLHDALEPGLKIATIAAEDKLKWILVAKIEDIYALYEENDHVVRLEINGYPKGYRMRFEYECDLKSFISYLGGYIRLTTKYMLDLCVTYPTPSLQELKKLRCHGPIGGSYSFAKIRQKRDVCGAYIIRQCEKEYDVYYIDINTKASGSSGTQRNERERCKTETFQIRREDAKWILNYNGQMHAFDQLTDLAQYIPTESEKFRIPPSEYDKPPSLLICLPKNLQSKKTETELSEVELQRKRAQIFDPKTDLQWYINSFKLCDNGKMFTMRADWIQQGSYKDVPVTLKVLNSDADFSEYMKVANTWSLIASPQFIKLYGLTLSTPYTMVMEYSKYGALNDFLYARRTEVTMGCLLDVMHGFVRGMHYLQDNGLIHSYIRCANLYVTKYDLRNNVLEAKINDPGFPRPYCNEDLPWIPFERYNDLDSARSDPNTQLWAFATTVWEIFARGRSITHMTAAQLRQNFNHYGGILEPLDEMICPKDIYETMMDGWSMDPDKRFNHQEIFARLSAIQNQLSPNYMDVVIATETCSNNSGYNSFNGHNGSISNLTFSNNSTTPLLSAFGANAGTGDGINGSAADMLGVGNSACFTNGATNQLMQFASRNYFPDTPSVLQIADGKVIYKEKDKIGQGHYGTVYRGEIRYFDKKRAPEQVAIKKLKSYQMKKLNDDFQREIKIMQGLDHPNVVKFKYWIDQPISIIMEYFEYGSFTVYLSSRKPNLTNEKLLRFALDIAEGMNYLRSKEVIHRDLAARNILVDHDCVKISDFGLAQIADSDGYYIARSVREIPIKWYSPESIKTSKFSFQSDVWSYGVTLFEMFSRGEIPNLAPGKELSQEEFLNMLEQGERLRQPALCPDLVYQQLMRPCWHANPKMRPTFKELIEIIKGESGESI